MPHPTQFGGCHEAIQLLLKADEGEKLVPAGFDASGTAPRSTCRRPGVV